jgi:hypothetical protein
MICVSKTRVGDGRCVESFKPEFSTVPVFVRYFAPTRGIQVKVIEFQNVTGETSEILVSHILSVLEKYKVTEKVIAFCGDNCNTNFGGLARKGKKQCFLQVKQV